MPGVVPLVRVEQPARVLQRLRVLLEDGDPQVPRVRTVHPDVLQRRVVRRRCARAGDHRGPAVLRAQPGRRADRAVLAQDPLQALVRGGSGREPVDVVVGVAGAVLVGAEEEHLLAVGQPGRGLRAPVGLVARLAGVVLQQGAVTAPAVRHPQMGPHLRLGVRGRLQDEGDEVAVVAVAHRVPRGLGRVAGRGVTDPALRAAGQGPLVDLPSARRVGVAGVGEPGAVRGERGRDLVGGRDGEPVRTGPVDADRPQVPWRVRPGLVGGHRVEDHRAPVRREFGVLGVESGGQLAYGTVRVAQVHLGVGGVAQAREDQQTAPGRGLLVEVRGAGVEERGAGLLVRVRYHAQGEVSGAGEGDPPGIGGRAVVRLGRGGR